MIWKLHALLDELAARRQRQRFHLGLAITWWAGIALGLVLWKSGLPPQRFLPVLIIAMMIAVVAVHFWSRRGLGDPRHIAREIEHRHPELQTALLAALDQKPDPGSRSLSFLQSRIIVESLAAAQRDQWLKIAPRPRLTAFRALHLGGAFLFALIACLMLLPRSVKSHTAATIGKPASTAPLAMSVDPGDVEIERGSPLTIQATFGKEIPTEANLEITDPSGISLIPLTRPFTDPVFQTRLDSVGAPMTYRVIIPAGASQSYSVRVFERPALKESEVVLHFPEHLGKPPQTIKDPHNFQAAERTRMELTLVANMPGLTATLVADKREPQKLEPDPADPTRHRFSEVLTRSVRYEIVLTDSAGRRNHRKDLLDIKVIPNKPPVIQVLMPRKDEKVTPIQEVRLEARITDDSGVLAHGLRYTVDGEKWEEITGSTAPGETRPVLSHLVDLEAVDAQPNDLIMWNAWAEDVGPDGKTRRVSGDIHLVSVRNFDEEFYQQAPQPPPPPGAAPPQTGDNLIKMQTKILNATWNTRRDHVDPADQPPPAAELETLHGSQEIAIQMATAMESGETDPMVRQKLTDARLAMKDASTQLAKAKAESSVAPLEAAIRHELAALRHLNQLMTSKTMVSRNRGQSGSESQENQVKEDLDLKPTDTPYQNEKAAAPELAQQANESMEILKRLDELAKRQRDLNEEMKALQMAANQAETPEKKAELERQLKQLRDQQRELLADVDKLQEKASESAPEQKEPLDLAREKARQASEELDKEKLGDALAAGRRAQEGLEQVHNDFRGTSAAKLAQQLAELRQQARDLEQRQRQLIDASPATEPAPKPTRLGESSPDSQPDIARQREDYQKLIESLRQTAEIAERAEPLVAKDLGEALRQADQAGIAKALDQIEKSGASNPAARRAAEGIGNLTREIETAAERILGNEAQALRYARDEIERLAEQAAGGQPKTAGDPAQANASGKGEKPGEGKTPSEGQGQANAEGQGTAPGNQPAEGKGEGQTAGRGESPGQGQAPSEGQTAGQGQSPGEGQSQTPGQGQSPGEGQTAGKGQSPGQGQGQTPREGQTAGRGQSPGQGQGQTPGEGQSQTPGQGQAPGEGQTAGQGQSPGEGQGQPGQGRGQTAGGNPRQGDRNRPSPGSGNGGGRATDGTGISGNSYEQWRDRLADLEAVVTDPDAQAAIARARQAGQEMRKDFKRHSKVPDPTRIENEILKPLAEAAKELDARLVQIDRKDPLAPVSRDPVPDRYAEIVRRYFEELGK